MGRNNNSEFSLSNYTEDELKDLRDIALRKYDDIVELWAAELQFTMNEKGFDQYTKRGEKKLNKITRKYAEMVADAEITLEMIQEELDKYEEYYEQQRYIEGGNYVDEELEDDEFLKREKEKTERIRDIISKR